MSLALSQSILNQNIHQIFGPPPQIDKAPSKDKLKSLEKELRIDTVEAATSQDSQLLGGFEGPSFDAKMEQTMWKNIYLRPQVQFKYEPNLLGDYSDLMKQMDGELNSVADSYVISTLESRRTPAKVADTSTDGYSLLANTFGLHERSDKTQKREMKHHRLSQEAVSAH